MKKFIKFLIIVWLSLLLWWTIFTQTQRGQTYRQEHLAPDANFLKSELLDALDATGVVASPIDLLSGDSLEYSSSGTVIVNKDTLAQRLDYYKKAKPTLWTD